jgi:hypothetical protein
MTGRLMSVENRCAHSTWVEAAASPLPKAQIEHAGPPGGGPISLWFSWVAVKAEPFRRPLAGLDCDLRLGILTTSKILDSRKMLEFSKRSCAIRARKIGIYGLSAETAGMTP